MTGETIPYYSKQMQYQNILNSYLTKHEEANPPNMELRCTCTWTHGYIIQYVYEYKMQKINPNLNNLFKLVWWYISVAENTHNMFKVCNSKSRTRKKKIKKLMCTSHATIYTKESTLTSSVSLPCPDLPLGGSISHFFSLQLLFPPGIWAQLFLMLEKEAGLCPMCQQTE